MTRMWQDTGLGFFRSIGYCIRKKRLEMGLSLEELAEYSQVSLYGINKCEHGTGPIALSSLYSICLVLGLDMQGLHPYASRTRRCHEIGTGVINITQGDCETECSELSVRCEDAKALIVQYWAIPTARDRWHFRQCVRCLAQAGNI
ncbi:MAG: helix-turn-helix transcriptional regulator [Pseudomonadota bacterium]